jgi:hypothetical protein
VNRSKKSSVTPSVGKAGPAAATIAAFSSAPLALGSSFSFASVFSPPWPTLLPAGGAAPP